MPITDENLRKLGGFYSIMANASWMALIGVFSLIFVWKWGRITMINSHSVAVWLTAFMLPLLVIAAVVFNHLSGRWGGEAFRRTNNWFSTFAAAALLAMIVLSIIGHVPGMADINTAVAALIAGVDTLDKQALVQFAQALETNVVYAVAFTLLLFMFAFAIYDRFILNHKAFQSSYQRSPNYQHELRAAQFQRENEALRAQVGRFTAERDELMHQLGSFYPMHSSEPMARPAAEFYPPPYRHMPDFPNLGVPPLRINNGDVHVWGPGTRVTITRTADGRQRTVEAHAPPEQPGPTFVEPVRES